ncbi:natural cytotoxicity triggering receptor 3 ligand 1-like [Megaptera novaeangliae]
MGNQTSGLLPPEPPLGCILKNWSAFDPDTLNKKRMVFFCNTAWPQYKLGSQEEWPLNDSINFNTILQLELFCKRQGKWSEIPYIQAFLALRDKEELCKTCKIDSAVLVLMRQPPSSPREDPSERGHAKRESEPDKSQREKIFKPGDSTKPTPFSIYIPLCHRQPP